MEIYQYVLGGLLIVFSLIVIVVVLMQEGRRQGVQGAVSGGGETFLSKNKSRSMGARLVRMTKWLSIIFFGLVIAANILALIFEK